MMPQIYKFTIETTSAEDYETLLGLFNKSAEDESFVHDGACKNQCPMNYAYALDIKVTNAWKRSVITNRPRYMHEEGTDE